MSLSRKAFVQLAEAIIEHGAKQAIKYCSSREVIKATRRGKLNRSDWHVEMIFSIGRPNYAERKFIKLAKKAGEPFPIKKVQLKFETKKRKVRA